MFRLCEGSSLFGHHLLGSEDKIFNNRLCRFYLLHHTGTFSGHVASVKITFLHGLPERSGTESKDFFRSN